VISKSYLKNFHRNHFYLSWPTRCGVELSTCNHTDLQNLILLIRHHDYRGKDSIVAVLYKWWLTQNRISWCVVTWSTQRWWQKWFSNLKLPLIWLLEFVKPLYLQCNEWSFKLYKRIRESFDVISICKMKINIVMNSSRAVFLIHVDIPIQWPPPQYIQWYRVSSWRRAQQHRILSYRSDRSGKNIDQPYLPLALAQSRWFYVLVFSLLTEFATVCNTSDAERHKINT
jgi:hypothetical protein